MNSKKLFDDGFINLGNDLLNFYEINNLIAQSTKLMEQAINNKDNLSKINISKNDFNYESIGRGGFAIKRADQHNREISKILVKIFENNKINNLLESCLGRNFKIGQIVIRKSSKDDKGLGLHQDGRGHMNLVILLDDNFDIYGSTVFLKNSHLINARLDELKLLTSPLFLKIYKFFLSYILGRRGDICLFLNRTWHGRYPANGKKSKFLLLTQLIPEGTSYGTEYDDWYDDDYLESLGNSTFRNRIDHKIETIKLNDRLVMIKDNPFEKISLKFESPKKNKVDNFNFANIFYVISVMLIVYPGRCIKKILVKFKFI
jgi:putative 2OG-Fe(II) oxygenase